MSTGKSPFIIMTIIGGNIGKGKRTKDICLHLGAIIFDVLVERNF